MNLFSFTLTTCLLISNIGMQEIPDEPMEVIFSEQKEWVKQVEVSISPIEAALYSMDGKNFQSDPHFVLTENGNYTFFIKKDETITERSYTISNIDTLPPIIDTYIRKGYTTPSIEIRATDLESGIVLYKIQTNQKQYQSTSPIFSLTNEEEQLQKIEVVDQVGHVTSCVITNDYFSDEVQIEMNDSTPYQKVGNLHVLHQNNEPIQYALTEKNVNVDDPSVSYSQMEEWEIKENGKYYLYAKTLINGEHYLPVPLEIEVDWIDSMAPRIQDIQFQSNYDESMSYSNPEKGVCVKVETVDLMKDIQNQVIEGGSGIQSIELMDPKGDIQSNLEGVFQIYENGSYTCIVKDQLDHVTKKEFEMNWIDQTPPSIEEAILSNCRLFKDHFFASKEEVKVSIPIKDEQAGMDPNNTYVLANSKKVEGVFEKDQAQFILDKENELLDIFIHAQDRVENKVEKRLVSLPILIEKESPSIQKICESILLDQKEWISKEQEIRFFIQDQISGLHSYRLYINGQEMESFTFSDFLHQYTIKVPTNRLDPQSKHSIRLIVEDHAGNESVYEQDLYFDLVEPKVQYRFDPVHDSLYYGENRTLSIQVQEINFDPSLVNTKIEIDGKEQHFDVQWKCVDGYELWQAVLVLNQDGDYVVSIDGMDKLGHRFDQRLNESFTIDQTKPKISCSFDHNTVANQKYYNQKRTLTIVIEERNFDEKKVKITGKNLPPSSHWIHEGNQHRQQIVFEQDGEYDVSIEAVDLAGNISQKVNIDAFVIDTIPPKLKVMQLENKAYSSKLQPIVEAMDQNFDGMEISIHRMKQKEVHWQAKKESILNGERIQYSNLEEKKENDDIYTMHIVLKDLANHMVEENIVFSVNRFGSTYKPDVYFQKVLDAKYNQEIEDIVFYEINVNEIQDVKLRLKTNETIRELKKDEFTLSYSQQDGMYIYEYRLDKALFKENGYYEIFVYSMDEANNRNENTMEDKQSMFTFAKDNCPPTIAISNLDAQIYNTDQQSFDVQVFDDVCLDQYWVKINGECVYTGNQTKTSYLLKASNGYQSIIVHAVDKAGNEYEKKIDSILVTKNVFYRWFYHRPLFITSIVVMFIGLIVWLMRKKLISLMKTNERD